MVRLGVGSTLGGNGLTPIGWPQAAPTHQQLPTDHLSLQRLPGASSTRSTDSHKGQRSEVSIRRWVRGQGTPG